MDKEKKDWAFINKTGLAVLYYKLKKVEIIDKEHLRKRFGQDVKHGRIDKVLLTKAIEAYKQSLTVEFEEMISEIMEKKSTED